MSNQVRLGIEAIVALALVVVIVMFFNQSGTLTETQDSLDSVQVQSTTLADNANATSTQAAVSLDNAAATNTQNSINLADANAAASQKAEEAAQSLADANGTSTRSALVSNAGQQRLAGTSTQSAEDSAQSLADANAAASQEADDAAQSLADANAAASQEAEDAAQSLADANATASQEADDAAQSLADANAAASQEADDANAASTQAANDIADLNENIAALNETITSLNEDLSAANSLSTTQAEQLEENNRTIDEQATEISNLQIGQDDSSDDAEIISIRDLAGSDSSSDANFVTDDYELELPQSYIAFDLIEGDRDAIADEIRDRGSEYETLADLAEQNQFIAIGFPEDFTLLRFEAFAVMQLSISSRYTFEDAIDEINAEESLEDSIQKMEVVELGGIEVLRIEINLSGIMQIQYWYLFPEERVAYVVLFTAFEAVYDEYQEDYDTSAGTFRLR